MRLVLASKSPRRAALLAQVDLAFEVRVADIDESVGPGESPRAYVTRMAQEKAAAVAAQLGAAAADCLVLGADTTVVADGKILGKPKGRTDARHMLGRLSGRTHEVMSGVALAGAYEAHVTSVTEVTFAALTSDEIDAYLATDEPWDKAGAYAIQGRAARFVSRIEGSYSGVVGLPLHETCRLIDEARRALGKGA